VKPDLEADEGASPPADSSPTTSPESLVEHSELAPPAPKLSQILIAWHLFDPALASHGRATRSGGELPALTDVARLPSSLPLWSRRYSTDSGAQVSYHYFVNVRQTSVCRGCGGEGRARKTATNWSLSDIGATLTGTEINEW